MNEDSMSKRESILWVSAYFLILVTVLFRILPFKVTVLADEFTFSLLSFFVPFQEAHIPSYLYFAIVGAAKSCGGAYYECARLMNVAFLGVSGLMVFLIARLFVPSIRLAAFVGALSLLLPTNIYAGFFMPEMVYLAGFLAFSYLMLSTPAAATHLRWALNGAGLGVLALIKPHALLLLPAVAVYMIVLLYRSSSIWRVIAALLIMAISCLAAKFLLGYVLAGSSGITLFGSTYGKIASRNSGIDRLMEMIWPVTVLIFGHTISLILIFGFPIAIALYSLFQRSNTSFLLAAYVLAIGVTMVVATAVFSASVGSTGPDDIPYRLHMRYYNFVYPLLLVLVATSDGIVVSKRGAAAIALPLAGVAIYLGISGIAPFTPNFIDSPFARGMTSKAVWTTAMAIGTVALIALWFRDRLLSRQMALFLVYPAVFIVAWQSINRDLSPRTVDGEYDRAGKIINLVSSEGSVIHISGDNYPALFRAAFYAQRRYININPKDHENADIIAYINLKPSDMSNVLYSDDNVIIMRRTK